MPRGHPENDPTPARPDPEVLIPHAGMWGVVIDYDFDAQTITATIDDFDDSGAYKFGPVPVSQIIGTGDVVGGRCFMHFDQYGEPGYAVVWRT